MKLSSTKAPSSPPPVVANTTGRFPLLAHGSVMWLLSQEGHSRTERPHRRFEDRRPQGVNFTSREANATGKVSAADFAQPGQFQYFHPGGQIETTNVVHSTGEKDRRVFSQFR